MTVGNEANHGYLCGVILKELSSGRKCEITGSVVAKIENIGDYNKNKDRLIGKFGEVVSRTSRSLIATRDPPPWAKKYIHEFIWFAEEMVRWEAPEDVR
jgi:hypothetical protein